MYHQAAVYFAHLLNGKIDMMFFLLLAKTIVVSLESVNKTSAMVRSKEETAAPTTAIKTEEIAQNSSDCTVCLTSDFCKTSTATITYCSTTKPLLTAVNLNSGEA